MSIWVHRTPDDAQKDVIKVFDALIEFESVSADFQKRFGLPFPFRLGVGINTGHASIRERRLRRRERFHGGRRRGERCVPHGNVH
jgi:hypothetical protein